MCLTSPAKREPKSEKSDRQKLTCYCSTGSIELGAEIEDAGSRDW